MKLTAPADKPTAKVAVKAASRGEGRIDNGPPVAVIDIGSNSVRLVVYEGLTRSLTPIFNEKVLAGLGREVLTTGLLAADAVDKALAALTRFRALCDAMSVGKVLAIATAACRDARNGPAFIVQAAKACGAPIDVLSGKREAELSALGIISGFHKPDGIVGDLGGGSLELTDVRGHRAQSGGTPPLGGLALLDVGAPARARRRGVRCAAGAAVPQCDLRGEDARARVGVAAGTHVAAPAFAAPWRGARRCARQIHAARRPRGDERREAPAARRLPA